MTELGLPSSVLTERVTVNNRKLLVPPSVSDVDNLFSQFDHIAGFYDRERKNGICLNTGYLITCAVFLEEFKFDLLDQAKRLNISTNKIPEFVRNPISVYNDQPLFFYQKNTRSYQPLGVSVNKVITKNDIGISGTGIAFDDNIPGLFIVQTKKVNSHPIFILERLFNSEIIDHSCLTEYLPPLQSGWFLGKDGKQFESIFFKKLYKEVKNSLPTHEELVKLLYRINLAPKTENIIVSKNY